MKNRRFLWLVSALSASAALIPAQLVQALTITDNFNGATPNNSWLLPSSGDGKDNVACLTAGSNATGAAPPRCPRLNDAVGSGALRLTDAVDQTHGAVVSDFTFPSGEGVQVTFTTYTYGGSGADGMTFFLADGAQDPSIGGTGGSLGYSCSNVNPGYNGVKGGYLGLGIDEYGNFMNRGDNTASGFNAAGNYQAAGANDLIAGRIGLRGAGNIWGNSQATINNACRTGKVNNVDVLDYPALAVTTLASDTPIGNQSKKCSDGKTDCSRAQATPIAYKLKITPDGYLSFWWSYNGGAYQALLTNKDISTSNGPMPANFRFGFTGATGGSTNLHEITCFQATPASSTNDSAELSLPTGQYKTGAQVYLASYHIDNSWGQLQAKNLTYDSSTGAVAVASTANWDASCVLTGGTCASTGVNTTAQTPSNRQIATWDGSKGIPFTWDSSATPATALTTAQKAYLNAGAVPNGEKLLNYLRGSRTNEIDTSGAGLFRARTGVLGDIVGSSPAWVGPPAAAYPSSTYSVQSSWKDGLYPSKTMSENAADATSYGTFQSDSGTRTNLVYIGANDGLLHAFRSGYYNGSGAYVGDSASIPNDGKELFAYMPGPIVKSIHNSTNTGVDFSSSQYGHNYFVDATPGTGDLFYDSKWHTWLVGGLGFGGQGIYAIDITDPSNLTEAKADQIVVGEWTFNSDTSSIWNNLGRTYGTPIIRRLHDGRWGIIFGNGWCLSSETTCTASNTGHAGIYILPIESTGAITSPIFLDTGSGSAASPNGIAYVTSADLDGDHVTDYIYAGDIAGQVWRFDLTSSTASSWGSPFKLFKTEAGQPITTQLTVSSSQSTSDANPRIIINFGTGQQLPQTISNDATYSTTTQALYGVWDWNMGNSTVAGSWNKLSTTQYASLTSQTTPLTQSNLQAQTTTTTNGNRSINDTTVCWKGSSTCSGGASNNTKFGWYMNLTSSTTGGKTVYEQVIYSPIIADGSFIVNTTIPPNNSPLTCTTNSASGWTIPLDPATGNGLPGFFSGDSTETVGYAKSLNATGSPSVIDVYGQPVLVTQTSSGTPAVNKIFPKATGRRINWIQLR